MLKQPINFTAEIANIKFIEEPLVVNLGDKKYVFEPDINKSFIHFDLLSSYKTVNKNNLTFTLPVLAKTFATAIYNPMDVEHILEGNPKHQLYDPEKDTNRIVGAMVLAYLPGIESFNNNIPLIPDNPMPMRIVAVIWKRTNDGAALIQSLAMGYKWSVSMEVVRDKNQDMYVNPADNTFYKPDEIPKELEGKLALAVGGKGEDEDTFVNFWGSGFTLTPADPTAKIHSLVASNKDQGALIAMDINNDDIIIQEIIGLLGFIPPESGNAPKEVKNILKDAYNNCRSSWVKDHPNDKENAKNKTSCARIAWSAVKKAGWHQDPKGNWTKSEGSSMILENTEPQIVVKTNGKKSGTELLINNEAIEFKSLYLSIWNRDDEDDKIGFEFTRSIDVGGGFVVNQRYEIGSNGKLNKVEGDNTMELSLAKIREELKNTEFKDWSSPEDVQAKLAAEAEKYKDYIAPDQLQSKIDTAIKAELSKKVEAFARRSEALKAAGLEVTAIRRDKIVAMDTEDEKAFNDFLAAEKANQEAMLNILKEKKIAVTDSIKKELAKFSGKDNSNFVSFLNGLSMVPATANVQTPSFIPGSGEVLDEQGGKKPLAAYH